MTTQVEEQATDMAFTGERFMPEVAGQIAFEHLHRYHFAARFCAGREVLDVACGEGYGSQILAQVASKVTGIDISAEAVAHASSRYGSDHLGFVEASAALLPLADDSVDVVVSFETIEHHDQHEEMLSEIKRVLRPGGLLVLSSPNKQHYSIDPGYSNPYHVKELFRDELVALVGRYFPRQQVYSQRVVYGSLLMAQEQAQFASIQGTGPDSCEWSEGLSRPLYDLVIATEGELPKECSTFFELKVHGLDAGTFYGVHLPERVSEADQEVLRLRARETALQGQLQHAAIEHLKELQSLRDARDELLGSLSVLGALVDDVRRERGSERAAAETQLDSLREALEMNRQQLADVSLAQASGLGQFKEQLDKVSSFQESGLGAFRDQLERVSNFQESGLGAFREQLERVSSFQESGLGAFREQLVEVRQQLAQAVAREERILGLEQLIAESQSIVLLHLNDAADVRQQLTTLAGQHEAARQELHTLKIELAEQRIIGEQREKDVRELKNSRSWRYTGWLRKLTGSARRHL